MRKIILKYTFLVISVIGLLTSCLDYDELRENPNDPTSVPPSLLFTGLMPAPTPSFSGTYYKMQYHFDIGTDNISNTNLSSGFGGSFSGYTSVRNIDKMLEEAEKVGANEYIIMAKFFRAYAYLEMSRRMGDIPLTESGSPFEFPQPAYTTQKDVYIQCLNWLDEANNELNDFLTANPGRSIQGDLYYNGNLKQWQKLINVYTLRILISLSKKSSDGDLNISGRFSAIVNNPSKYPLFTSNADNAMFDYRDEDGFRQRYQPNNAVLRESQVYASTYINILKNKQDPRLMKIADPTRDALEAGSNEAAVRADFNSYAGADISEQGTVNSALKLDGDFSFPNFDRFWNFVGQPGVWLSYWEQELTIAEAANRGWISASASDHYNNGVAASMLFYGLEETQIVDYLSNKQPYVSGEAGLTRILEQKYLAFAENSGEESFFTTRRTGVPTYVFSDFNSIDQYPVRWTYPSSELLDNAANYKAALVSQFGSEVDDRDQVIWILKD